MPTAPSSAGLAMLPSASLTSKLKVTFPKVSSAAVGRDTPLESQSPWLFCIRMRSDSNINNKAHLASLSPRFLRLLGPWDPIPRVKNYRKLSECPPLLGSYHLGSAPVQEAASHSRSYYFFNRNLKGWHQGGGTLRVGRM